MSLGFVLGSAIAAAMVLVAAVGAVRWSRLDRGGRWFVGAVMVSAAFIPFSLGIIFGGGSNRLLNEASLLAETVLILIGFAWWQPSGGRHRVIWGILAGFVVSWVVAQAIQGRQADFSVVSIPVADLVKVGAAGFTLVTLVRSIDGRWTDHFWFWAALGIMVIYGTGVLLDPLWFQTFGLRNDLVIAAFAVNTLGQVVGYALIARGLWRLPAAAVAA